MDHNEELKDEPMSLHNEKASLEKDSEVHNNGKDSIQRDWTPEEEKKLVRKVDLRMYPMLCIVFGLSLMDRANISLAYIAGMGEDLHLDVGTRYNIALLVFFVPYFLFEVPSNWVIRRVGARFWLAVLIFCWGVCVLGMGFVRNWQSLAGLRAALGFFEAGLLPGALFLISCWYLQYEMATRVTGFWMTSQLASAFGPIFAYALSLINVGDGMFTQGWRWIYIIEGIVTIVAGIVTPIFLLEFPERAKFLSEREKTIATERMQLERERRQVRHPTAWETVKVLLDWKVLCFCLQYFIAASSIYSLAYFAPIILLEGLEFTYTKAQLLSTPPYVFAIICSIAMAKVSDMIRLRWPVMIFQALMAITGLLIILYAKPAGVRYFGLFVASYGIQSNVPSVLSYSQNQTGRPERKGITSAAVVSAGALGGICGSTIFRSEDAPEYIPGMWSTIAMQFLFIVITFSLSTYFKRQNRLADEGKKVMLEGVEGFRYAP